MNDRITTATTHAAGWWSAGMGVLSFNEWAIVFGLLLSLLSFLLSWYYKRANHRAVVELVRKGHGDKAETVGVLHEKVNR